MRTLEDIEKDLAAARETLSSVEGTPAEVYSRIVGYYRSVRNWNRGKREEYGERRLYNAAVSMACLGERSRITAAAQPAAQAAAPIPTETLRTETKSRGKADSNTVSKAEQRSARLLLFVRPACPSCPSAKEAAGRLGIPVDLVNADTEAGLAEAARRNVLSTPTAILLSAGGEELDRARDPLSIASFKSRIAS
jgi:ribonucleoside-triphosphate reductase